MSSGLVIIGSNSYEKLETFKYLGSLLTNQNSIQEEIKCRLGSSFRIRLAWIPPLM